MAAFIERTIRTGAAAAIVALLALLAVAAEAPAAGSGAQGGVSSSPAVEPTAPPVSTGRQVFPIRGAYEFWDGFGAGRNHQGADVGATCGTPLVAVAAARVRMSKFHARAGNYAVLDLKGSELDLVYAHMVEPALVPAGTAVAAGQTIGYVGDTGNASGCHLHFELWEGAYYGGGAAIDPMPFLESLDRERKRLRRRAG
ncbi:MAG: M23 family metallopeptidase [Solirubrobacterales bacterium]